MNKKISIDPVYITDLLSEYYNQNNQKNNLEILFISNLAQECNYNQLVCNIIAKKDPFFQNNNFYRFPNIEINEEIAYKTISKITNMPLNTAFKDFNLKPISDKKWIINILKEQQYDKIMTFLVYPMLNNKFINNHSNQIVKLTNINKLENKINLNHIAFVGLNASNFEDDHFDYSDFQTMHNYQYRYSHDRNLANMINESKYKNQLLGSFAFDILNNVTSTNINIINGVCDKIKHNQKTKKLEINKIYAELIPNKQIKKIKEKKLSRKQQIKKIYKHLIIYDIPILKSLIKIMDLKTLICLGQKSKLILDTIAKYDLTISNMDIQEVSHFASHDSNQEKIESINNLTLKRQ